MIVSAFWIFDDLRIFPLYCCFQDDRAESDSITTSSHEQLETEYGGKDEAELHEQTFSHQDGAYPSTSSDDITQENNNEGIVLSKQTHGIMVKYI